MWVRGWQRRVPAIIDWAIEHHKVSSLPHLPCVCVCVRTCACVHVRVRERVRVHVCVCMHAQTSLCMCGIVDALGQPVSQVVIVVLTETKPSPKLAEASCWPKLAPGKPKLAGAS